MSGNSVLRTSLIVILVLLVQATAGLDLSVAGAHPDIAMLLPVGAALVAGPEDGAIMGFVTGIIVDLFLATPFGLSALVYCLLGFVVGAVAASVDRSDPWLAPLAALIGSAAAVMLYAVLGAVLGQEQFLRGNLAAVVAMVAVVNALLAIPVTRLVRWAMGGDGRNRPRTLVSGARW